MYAKIEFIEISKKIGLLQENNFLIPNFFDHKLTRQSNFITRLCQIGNMSVLILG